MKYELIEHTADVGIRIKGRDLKELFANAAAAMFDIAAQKRHAGDTGKVIKVKAKGANLEELLVNWLNELLSVSAVKELIFRDFKIDVLDGQNLSATVEGSSASNYKINTEIKAATYHQLQVKEHKPGWQAEVIFDV